MSRRTSEANKAVASAWTNEKQLVLDGKGTRDWTPEQQRQILEKGKAYNGGSKAFEGHHMKSVEAHPDYQGDAQNIQFLTRDEHINAHNGNTQSPTNGYFNPHTGETTVFADDSCEPCKVMELSEPIELYTDEQAAALENTDIEEYIQTDSDNQVNDRHGTGDRTTEPLEHKQKPRKLVASDMVRGSQKIVSKPSARRIKTGLLDKVATSLGFGTRASLGRAVISKLPQLAMIAAPFIVDGVLRSISRKKAALSNPVHTDGINIDLNELSNKNDSLRSSPIKHMVNTKGQHYNTKNGRIWKTVNPYPRGEDK